MDQKANPLTDRFCDLVMKGGVTSGIVYPLAILELAQHYRFKNIGGTSAGAIAAAATAAAEYQRRQAGSMAGFQRLAQLPEELGQRVSDDQSKLLTLFQPNAGCKRLFKVLVCSLNRKTTSGRATAIVWGFIRAYKVAALLSVVAAALVWWLEGLLSALLFFIIAMVASIGYLVYRDITRNVVRNNYGLCKGMTEDKNGLEALTPWLHTLIQKAAGRETTDPPLTFGDLWIAPGFPPKWLEIPPNAQIKSIDLQMFTTNLSHGRPYVMPSAADEERLFYNSDELSAYLPTAVMEWIDQHAQPYEQNPREPRGDPNPAAAMKLKLKELPQARDLPVLLAARMSLSFPFLFSAVPLWAIDYEPEPEARGFSRCMFSDGGICSNFPVHLFDGLLPIWPTFGILLEPKPLSSSSMTFLPKRYEEGYTERWERFASQGKTASRLGGFLASIVNAMQNWSDNTLSRMPGVRDRVVRLRLNDNEGGLNLNMEETLLTEVANRGADAAAELIGRYVPTETDATMQGWDDQRWARLDVLVRMLKKRLPGVWNVVRGNFPHARTYQYLIDQALVNPPTGHDKPLTAAEATALRDFINSLEALSMTFEQKCANYSFDPIPEPELRVRPQI